MQDRLTPPDEASWLPARLADATWGSTCGCHDAAGRRAGTTRRGFGLFTGLILAGAGGSAMAQQRAPAPAPAARRDEECKISRAAGLVPAASVEQSAAQQYVQLMREANSKGALATREDEQLQRLRYIAARIVPLTVVCNERARQWQWDVQLLKSNQVNAFCMPGGKIAFFTGILSKLKLDDNEVAMIMGHEVAHALLEHARERMAKSGATSGLLRIGAAVLGLGALGDLAAQGGAQLLSLKFSRSDESEADALGLLLAARAGYDPRSGVSLWQKMSQLSAGKGQPGFLSTHPSGPQRIKDIESRLARMSPIYNNASKPDRQFPLAA